MSVGPWQVVIILVIILLLFGAGKLPSVMKDLAKGVQAFKKGLREEADDAAEALDTDTNSDKSARASEDTPQLTQSPGDAGSDKTQKATTPRARSAKKEGVSVKKRPAKKGKDVKGSDV